MLVTRHQRLTDEPKREFSDSSEPFFVDWLSMHQTHDHDLPVIDDGHVIGVECDGSMAWRTSRKARVEGSYETAVLIRCDGRTVLFEGNVSRFGRPDNVFGYDLASCIRRVNEILARFGLPPFTQGRKGWRIKTSDLGGQRIKSGEVESFWTGARISRIDLTANFEAGSLADARAYLAWLESQQHSARVKVGTHPDGETVDWGRGSRRIYSKVYLKSAELRRHGAPADLIQYCENTGLIRFEVTVKSTQLIAMGCQYLGGFDMAQIVDLFEDRRQVMTRAEHSHDDLEHLPNHFRRTARDYLAGDDLKARMSLATFKRHRKALLGYGLDIAVRRNVIEFKPRVRVIEVRPAIAPSWYHLAKVA